MAGSQYYSNILNTIDSDIQANRNRLTHIDALIKDRPGYEQTLEALLVRRALVQDLYDAAIQAEFPPPEAAPVEAVETPVVPVQQPDKGEPAGVSVNPDPVDANGSPVPPEANPAHILSAPVNPGPEVVSNDSAS